MCAIAVLGFGDASAHAAVGTVSFDEYPNGTEITNQYEPQGVVFADGAKGFTGFTPKIHPPPGGNSAPPGTLGGFTRCTGSGEFAFCDVDLWMKFSLPQRSLVLRIGHAATTLADFQVTAEFYDLEGTKLGTASTTVPKAAGMHEVVLRNGNYFPCSSDPCQEGEAYWVRLVARGDLESNREILIDDLRFRASTTPPPPEFSIVRDPQEILFGDEVGIRTTDPERPVGIVINRIGPVGDLDFAVDAPPWLSATVDPDPTSAKRTTLKLKVIDPNAPPADRWPVVVKATRTADPGAPPKTLTVPVTLTREYDIQTLGMIAFQGPQTRQALRLTGVDGRIAPYEGVRLAGGGKTVVAVFANALTAPPAGIQASASLTVAGADGKPLKGVKTATIFASGGGKSLTTAYPDVESLTDAFVFTLPRDWTTVPGTALKREIRLTARVHGPGQTGQIFNPDPLRQCATPQCTANDQMTVTGVPFERMGSPVRFRWYDLYWSHEGQGGLPVNTSVKLEPLFESLIPHDQQSIQVIPSDVALDVSGVVADYDACFPFGTDDKDCTSSMQLEIMNEVDEYDWDNPTAPSALPVGLLGGGIINGTSMPEGGCVDTQGLFNVTCFNPGVALVEVSRPLTSVAHEQFHLLGEDHFDTQCGGNSDGQVGGDFAGDGGWGTFEGRVLDRSQAFLQDPTYPSLRLVPRPSAVMNNNLPAGLRGRFVDFMSYCVSEADAWLSVSNWQRLFDRLVHKPPPKLRGRAVRGAQREGEGMRVAGYLKAGRATITHVRRTDRLSAAPPERSDLHLQVPDANGRPVVDVPMTIQKGHVDGYGQVLQFSAEVPQSELRAAQLGDGFDRIDIVGDRATLASRQRSPTVPEATVLSPNKGQTVGKGKTVAIRWEAADRDGGPFAVGIDYSADGGHTWRTIHEQASLDALPEGDQSVKVPSRLLSRSKNARVRVRVNDGFNQAEAVSGRFTALGAPPAVRILSPAAGFRTRNEAVTALSGAALDDRERPILKGLVWYAGKRKIASGPDADAIGLPPGKRVVLRLEARDYAGRRASAKVIVRVDAAAPRLLSLSAPKSVPRTAKSFKLKLASSLPSRLAIKGGAIRPLSANADTKARSYRVRLARVTGTPIKLEVRIAAGGKASKVKLTLPRG